MARLFLFLRFGRWGMRMRAAGQNPLLAAQRGINLHAIYALAWGLSTLTGSLAGMLIALDSGLTGIDGGHRPEGFSRRAGRRARQLARRACSALSSSPPRNPARSNISTRCCPTWCRSWS